MLPCFSIVRAKQTLGIMERGTSCDSDSFAPQGIAGGHSSQRRWFGSVNHRGSVNNCNCYGEKSKPQSPANLFELLALFLACSTRQSKASGKPQAIDRCLHSPGACEEYSHNLLLPPTLCMVVASCNATPASTIAVSSSSYSNSPKPSPCPVLRLAAAPRRKHHQR